MVLVKIRMKAPMETLKKEVVKVQRDLAALQKALKILKEKLKVQRDLAALQKALKILKDKLKVQRDLAALQKALKILKEKLEMVTRGHITIRILKRRITIMVMAPKKGLQFKVEKVLRRMNNQKDIMKEVVRRWMRVLDKMAVEMKRQAPEKVNQTEMKDRVPRKM